MIGFGMWHFTGCKMAVAVTVVAAVANGLAATVGSGTRYVGGAVRLRKINYFTSFAVCL